jgi:hypothetical protein
MAVVGIKLVVDGKLVRSSLQDLSAEIPKIGTAQIYRAMVRARSKLRKKASRPTYPIPWDNIKQKIKVIILLKQTNNLPYRRKGDYNKGFVVVKTENGYELVNNTEKASFIGGDAEGKGQSRIFRERYPLIRSVVDTEFEKVPSAVVEHIQLVAKEKGFGP